MRWYDVDPGRGVLEIEYEPSNEPAKAEVDLELAVYWGGGERTRAAWLLSQDGRVLAWAVVGEA